MRANIRQTKTAETNAPELTHEGAVAAIITPEQALRRSVMACMLFESEFYEDGIEIAQRIAALSKQVSVKFLGDLAVEARTVGNLRHAPLWLLVHLIKRAPENPALVADAISRTVQRADEAMELLALYWKANGRDPQARGPKKLAAQLMKGLRRAVQTFDEYQLAKYSRFDKGDAVKLRDVIRLVHAKPRDEAQAALWKRVLDRKLAVPDTWETELLKGGDKKQTFERLIREGKLGYLALLRNLRGMGNAGVDEALIKAAIVEAMGSHRVLPFRYVAAARAAPRFEREIDIALSAKIDTLPRLLGRTAVLVDVSASMDAKLSAKSDMERADAAAALASLINAENLRVFSFSDSLVEVPPRRGMAGVDAIMKSQPHSGTQLFVAVDKVNKTVDYDRLIVITDEQAFYDANRPSGLPNPKGKGYMINVASAKNGVGYGEWVHIDGFSENVIRFIHGYETAA